MPHSTEVNIRVRQSAAPSTINAKKELSELGELIVKESNLKYFPLHAKCKSKIEKGNKYLYFGAKWYQIRSGQMLSDHLNKNMKCILSGSDLFNGNGEKIASIEFNAIEGSINDQAVYNRKEDPEIIGVFSEIWGIEGYDHILKDIGGSSQIVSRHGDYKDVNFLLNDKEKIEYLLPKDFKISK